MSLNKAKTVPNKFSYYQSKSYEFLHHRRWMICKNSRQAVNSYPIHFKDLSKAAASAAHSKFFPSFKAASSSSCASVLRPVLARTVARW